MPKERPILFSAAMVQALLAGRKTQTRRIVKPQPPAEYDHLSPLGLMLSGGCECATWENSSGSRKPGMWSVRCPFGTTGDRLWVRENWRVHGWNTDGTISIEYPAGGSTKWIDDIENEDLFYRLADQSHQDWVKAGGHGDGDYCLMPEGVNYRTRPSIHMPRWASRLLLEITNVRVERLHAIKDRPEDVLAEGLVQVDDHIGPRFGLTPDTLTNRTAWAAFSRLWDQINGQGAWDANPYVWVVEFKAVTA